MPDDVRNDREDDPHRPEAALPLTTDLTPQLDRLGPFRLLEVLGEGGMGLVYRAEDSGLGREVALKVMKPELACHRLPRERFLREARAAAAVHHDHVVPIFQVGEDQNVPYIAMPLLAGES